MVFLDKQIKVNELENIEPGVVYLPDMIKGVVDVKKELVGLNAAMHADIEKAFLENGSEQKDLYGFNILYDDYEIEYDSMINIPRNRDLGYPRGGTTLQDTEMCEKIREVIEKWIIF